MVECVQAVVEEHVDGRTPLQQRSKFVATVADDQRPVPLKISGDEVVVPWLAMVPTDLEAVQLASTVPDQRRENVSAGGAVQNPGFDDHARPCRPYQQVQRFAPELTRGAEPIWPRESL
jgi:hypothetical protein